ncbi:MAG: hypothetical protein HYU88_11470 [Chloroflexi bacterium]|nr:hypothetical protein [Chloroflexota bacterium]MBI4504395.1 hypothetical protein [Chloroflexota bacterium]
MLHRVRAAAPAPAGTAQPKPGAAPAGADFAQVLATQQAGLRFSAHAQARLATRPTPLDGHDLARIEAAVDRAAQKGARESLVLYDDLALVVSVRNRTVITAVDAARRRANVFTNVDSVVIVEGGVQNERAAARQV